VTLTGLAYEMLRLPAGDVIYASGQPYAFLPPYWLIALWALLACALNVSMRWIRNRPLVAALCGLLGGPASFLAGVRLGAAQFVDMQAALFALAAGWCFMLPLLGWLATRYDGYAPAPPHPRSASALTEEA
ncbi:MAG: DUF2878 family protein, partial [Rhodocyclaceae bacterium]|nr:DUF2878 family protein [Rhodocyclaceae bacterium]